MKTKAEQIAYNRAFFLSAFKKTRHVAIKKARKCEAIPFSNLAAKEKEGWKMVKKTK